MAENAPLVESLEAAREYSLLPSQFFGASASDRAAIVALHRHKQRLHRCGRPIEESFDDEMSGSYKVQQVVCHACSALERRSDGSGGTVKEEPGEVLYVVPTWDPKTQQVINE